MKSSKVKKETKEFSAAVGRALRRAAKVARKTARMLRELWNGQLAALQDPMGVSGYIYPCQSDAQYQDAISKVQTAVTRAENARDAAYKENIEDAFYWWRLLYNYEFPTYYYS